MQIYIDRYFYYLFLFTLTFGVVFYTIIGFDYTDEICALGLFFLFVFCMIQTPNWEMNKALLLTLFVFLFYLGYSMWIGSNSVSGILNDLFVQIKPYLGFFCVYAIKPKISEGRKSIIRALAVALWLFILSIGIGDLFVHRLMHDVFGHEAHFAATALITSLCYLYTSKFSTIDKLKFLGMLAVGLLSGRSKFYGFFAMSMGLMLFFMPGKMFKLSLRNTLILAGMLGVMVIAAWQKIDLYFVQAFSGEIERSEVARFMLYAATPIVLADYFPFGSGLASFATYHSGQYYSPLYSRYDLDRVWGLSKDYYAFVADTYYPSLAQFGVVGIALYASFWIYIFRKGYKGYITGTERNKALFYIILLIAGYLAIDGIADATFISYRGFFT
ncbi:MAG: O-antigen ligase domain-containing protein, partial [Tannerellaceae bacterium]|nr:O-antigen ligase domain-containing protein [Tannerellaceae bacterium]